MKNLYTTKWFKTSIKTHRWKKIHTIESLCLQNGFEMSENSKKNFKNTSKAKPPSLTHYFLDWYEISATQTRLVCATFPKKWLKMEFCMKKKQATEVHWTPKMARL